MSQEPHTKVAKGRRGIQPQKGWALVHNRAIQIWAVEYAKSQVIEKAEQSFKACWATLRLAGWSVIKVRIVPENLSSFRSPKSAIA